ncbi:Uncharacterised protein [Collinsella intestinalis]|nr:Uncharacterised protein [Collinsella intestinalis]
MPRHRDALLRSPIRDDGNGRGPAGAEPEVTSHVNGANVEIRGEHALEEGDVIEGCELTGERDHGHAHTDRGQRTQSPIHRGQLGGGMCAHHLIGIRVERDGDSSHAAFTRIVDGMAEQIGMTTMHAVERAYGNDARQWSVGRGIGRSADVQHRRVVPHPSAQEIGCELFHGGHNTLAVDLTVRRNHLRAPSTPWGKTVSIRTRPPSTRPMARSWPPWTSAMPPAASRVAQAMALPLSTSASSASDSSRAGYPKTLAGSKADARASSLSRSST